MLISRSSSPVMFHAETHLDESGFNVAPNKAYVVSSSVGQSEGTQENEYCTIPEQTDNVEYSYIDTAATVNVNVC